MEEKKEENLLQQRKKALCFAPQNGYDRLEEGETAKISAYCDGYKTFLDEGKTERECVDYAVALARAAGFRPLVRGRSSSPGTRSTATTGASPFCWRSSARRVWTKGP